MNNKIMNNLDKYQLQSHNIWWIRPELILEDTKIRDVESQKYKYLPPLYFNYPLEQDAILTLRGPRQVGKTSLLKLIIRRLLLEEKVLKEAIFFYPCDRISDYNDLFNLLNEYLAFGRPRTNSRLYIFLDEISFVKEWQRAIKQLADMAKLKNTTLLLTGSNILDISFSAERMPGRRGKITKPDIELLPLDFADFLNLVRPGLKRKGYQEGFVMNLPELKKMFEDFILTGGFLVNINNFYQKDYIPSYLYEMYASWIEGDLHKVGKSEEVALKIFERIISHLTTPVSYYKLAKESGLASHLTASDYLDILQKMFVLFKTEYLSIEKKRTDFKKNRKIYFFDPFILQVITARMQDYLDDAFNYSRRTFLSDQWRPRLAELMVGASLKRTASQLYYGMSQYGEIDFASKIKGQYSFIEVKYQRGLTIKDFRYLRALFKEITIITPDTLQQESNISLIPLEIFLAYKKDFIQTEKK